MGELASVWIPVRKKRRGFRKVKGSESNRWNNGEIFRRNQTAKREVPRGYGKRRVGEKNRKT